MTSFVTIRQQLGSNFLGKDVTPIDACKEVGCLSKVLEDLLSRLHYLTL